MNQNRIRVSLLIYEYKGGHDEISNALKLKPTLTVEANAERGGLRRWELVSGVADGEPVEKHIAALLSQLHPQAEALRMIAKDTRCLISVGLEYIEYNPEITFSPAILQQLADLGVELWLDIYNLSDDDEDEIEA